MVQSCKWFTHKDIWKIPVNPDKYLFLAIHTTCKEDLLMEWYYG